MDKRIKVGSRVKVPMDSEAIVADIQTKKPWGNRVEVLIRKDSVMYRKGDVAEFRQDELIYVPCYINIRQRGVDIYFEQYEVTSISKCGKLGQAIHSDDVGPEGIRSTSVPYIMVNVTKGPSRGSYMVHALNCTKDSDYGKLIGRPDLMPKGEAITHYKNSKNKGFYWVVGKTFNLPKKVQIERGLIAKPKSIKKTFSRSDMQQAFIAGSKDIPFKDWMNNKYLK